MTYDEPIIIEARYDGVCPECGDDIEIGDDIACVDDVWVCIDCA